MQWLTCDAVMRPMNRSRLSVSSLHISSTSAANDYTATMTNTTSLICFFARWQTLNATFNKKLQKTNQELVQNQHETLNIKHVLSGDDSTKENVKTQDKGPGICYSAVYVSQESRLMWQEAVHNLRSNRLTAHSTLCSHALFDYISAGRSTHCACHHWRPNLPGGCCICLEQSAGVSTGKFFAADGRPSFLPRSYSCSD